MPHLSVRRSGNGGLVATTTAYGHAPDDIVRCRSCGHMQVTEFPPEAELDEDYAEVSESAYLEEEAGQRATADRALDRIEHHVARGALLDVGCWLGFLLSQAERRGWRVRGVEPSRFASAFARDQLGLDVHTGTVDSLEQPGESVDAVTMCDVIEHLPDPGRTLQDLHRALRPNGVLYLALPDAGSAVARGLGARWWSVIPTHVQYFTGASVARLLVRNGFAVEWSGRAPKAFTVRYYAERLEGYSAPVARAVAGVTEAVRVADRLVWPNFGDRMAVVARKRAA